MEPKKVIEDLKKNFPDGILKVYSQFGDDNILFSKDILLEISEFLKAEPYEFSMLLDLTCVDYQGEKDRFEMVYHFFSLKHLIRLRFKTRLAESDLKIDSLTGLWRNANWLEREVFDMFGITFNGHPYMRRIFMYDGFEGHPLRKDYPLRKRQPILPMREKK